MSLRERFLTYVSFDTQSSEESDTTPSTQKQWDLAKYLYKECQDVGFDEVTLDEHGIVYAKIQGDSSYDSIGFLAHMDTALEMSGKDVKPQCIEYFDGSPIVFEDGTSYEIEGHLGESIITTDGTTLLGGDDKAGIAIIMEAMDRILHSDTKHGPIMVAFTVDEEIGKGTDCFDLNKFPVDYAYTVDGADIDSVEYETFNAAQAQVIIHGISIHPGDAKNRMVNASLLANEWMNQFPENETPATTEGYEGFYHLLSMEGTCEQAKLTYLIRDHDWDSFQKRKEFVKTTTQTMNQKYNNCIECEVVDQYHNMVQYMNGDMKSVDRAKKAIQELGLTPKSVPVRGGTDGAMLTEKGLICPNLGTGSYNHHGRMEFASLTEMEKMVKIVMNIIKEV